MTQKRNVKHLLVLRAFLKKSYRDLYTARPSKYRPRRQPEGLGALGVTAGYPKSLLVLREDLCIFS